MAFHGSSCPCPLPVPLENRGRELFQSPRRGRTYQANRLPSDHRLRRTGITPERKERRERKTGTVKPGMGHDRGFHFEDLRGRREERVCTRVNFSTLPGTSPYDSSSIRDSWGIATDRVRRTRGDRWKVTRTRRAIFEEFLFHD